MKHAKKNCYYSEICRTLPDDFRDAVALLPDYDLEPLKSYDLEGNFEIIVQATKNFFSMFHLQLHDVYCIDPSFLEELGKQKKSILEMQQEIQRNAKRKDPFHIPIVFEGSGFCDFTHFPEDHFSPAYIQKISLPTEINERSVSLYVHELTHAELASVPNSIRYSFHKEFLSIFLELLTMEKIDDKFLERGHKNLLSYLKKSINYILDENAIESKKKVYFDRVVSILKAESFFKKFNSSSPAEKERMMKVIQAVFDGHLSIEDLLDIYGITYENSISEFQDFVDSNVKHKVG